ncbi:uncharacterized protein LOC122260494 [Penaeus japonicus]|uniref:uncharacterized protein LOC122260494 n=1 Tax=Penaeus japonicus TaxID=27405 RepID=UPI001C714654|nr:uncharacterized protein LOC122260494 [Penaeus japonicus]
MAEFEDFRDVFENVPCGKSAINIQPSGSESPPAAAIRPERRNGCGAEPPRTSAEPTAIVPVPGPPQAVMAAAPWRSPAASRGVGEHEEKMPPVVSVGILSREECSSPSALSAAARIEAQVDRIDNLKADLDISTLSPDSQLVVGLITKTLRNEVNDLKSVLQQRYDTIQSEIRSLSERQTSLETKIDDCYEKLKHENAYGSLWCCFG